MVGTVKGLLIVITFCKYVISKRMQDITKEKHNFYPYWHFTNYTRDDVSNSKKLYLMQKHGLSFDEYPNNSECGQRFLPCPDHFLEDIQSTLWCSAHESQVASVNCSQGEVLLGFLKHMSQKSLEFTKTSPFGPANHKVNLHRNEFEGKFAEKHKSGYLNTHILSTQESDLDVPMNGLLYI